MYIYIYTIIIITTIIIYIGVLERDLDAVPPRRQADPPLLQIHHMFYYTRLYHIVLC